MLTVEPVPESSVSAVDDRTPEDKERWWRRGLRAISEGKLAVVLLAGGQVLMKNYLRLMCLSICYGGKCSYTLLYRSYSFLPPNCVQGTRLGSTDPKGCFSKSFHPRP